VHQVGRDQKRFFECYAEEILPALKSITGKGRGGGKKARPRKGRSR